MIRIGNSTALVTGANRGIGRALAEALLERGAKRVYAGVRDPASVQGLTKRWGARLVPVRLDVTKAADVAAAAERASDVNVLINNAGVAELGFRELLDPEYLDAGRREFEVNLLGSFAMTQAFAPVLAANGGGALANIVSIAAFVNFPMFPSYSTSKAALHSLTQATRLALAGRGTSVHGVYPGPVDTEMAAELPFEKTDASTVAAAILDGIEGGVEEIFPDGMAQQFGDTYATDPKELERQVAALAAA